MSALDGFLTSLLLKCDALRQKAAVSCYRELVTISNPRAGLQIYMRHSEALSEKIGAIFRADAQKILTLSSGNKLEARKSCGLFLLILTCSLDGRMTQEKERIHFASGDDLNPEYLLRTEPNPRVKIQLLDRWRRAVNAMLQRQMALFEIELDQLGKRPQERSSSRPETSSKRTTDSPTIGPPISFQDPKRGPLILLIQAARDFDLPKGSLTRARQQQRGTPGYLESFSDGKNVWVYRNDVQAFARSRQAVRRRNPFSQ